jgi:hypothetical protein
MCVAYAALDGGAVPAEPPHPQGCPRRRRLHVLRVMVLSEEHQGSPTNLLVAGLTVQCAIRDGGRGRKSDGMGGGGKMRGSPTCAPHSPGLPFPSPLLGPNTPWRGFSVLSAFLTRAGRRSRWASGCPMGRRRAMFGSTCSLRTSVSRAAVLPVTRMAHGLQLQRLLYHGC